MHFCSLSQSQRNKFRTVTHEKYRGIFPVCCDPTEHSNHTSGRQAEVYFDRQSLVIKIIDDIKCAKVTAENQRVMHKINRPALVQNLRCDQRRWVTYRLTPFAFATKIQLQQAVNPVDTLMIPGFSLSAKNLK